MTSEDAHDPGNAKPPAEDRLEDGTLGGYLRFHERPPGFQGSDGHPYTVSIETEKTSDLLAPILGYLVFPCWADSGVGITGHVETPILVQGQTRAEVEERLGKLTLGEVRELLEQAIRHQRNET